VNKADLALTASRTRLLAENLGDSERDALIAEWGHLIDAIEDARPADADSALTAYRTSLDERLATFTPGDAGGP
jgi:hypothetical protein